MRLHSAPPPPPPPPQVAAFVLGLGAAPDTTPSSCLSVASVLSANDVTLPPAALAACPDTLFAWADSMDTFGPDNFSTLQRCVKDETPNPSLKLACAVLRMSCWDADVFFKFKQTLIDRSTSASDKQQADLLRDVFEVAARYFPLQASKDVSFELGRICMGLQRYPQAIALFDASQRQCGEHHVSRRASRAAAAAAGVVRARGGRPPLAGGWGAHAPAGPLHCAQNPDSPLPRPPLPTTPAPHPC